MTRPVRTTVVFGLIAALAALLWPPVILKPAMWAILAVYALLLVRWSGSRPGGIVFPLLLLLGAALWPWTGSGFAFGLLWLGVFGWIRSGICFSRTPLRAIAAEILLLPSGIGPMLLWGHPTLPGQALQIWLFFLVQSLYFFIVPSCGPDRLDEGQQDPFEQARAGAERVLRL